MVEEALQFSFQTTSTCECIQTLKSKPLLKSLILQHKNVCIENSCMHSRVFIDFHSYRSLLLWIHTATILLRETRDLGVGFLLQIWTKKSAKLVYTCVKNCYIPIPLNVQESAFICLVNICYFSRKANKTKAE